MEILNKNLNPVHFNGEGEPETVIYLNGFAFNVVEETEISLFVKRRFFHPEPVVKEIPKHVLRELETVDCLFAPCVQSFDIIPERFNSSPEYFDFKVNFFECCFLYREAGTPSKIDITVKGKDDVSRI